jgi:ferredoxin
MDRVLGWLFKQVEVAPDYHQGRCLAVKGTGCRACADVCPHDAVTVGRRVEIDPVDCTGCGLCVRACPSGALEPAARAPVATPVRCSVVHGDAASVECLARLSPTDVLRLVDERGTVRLARGDCSACTVGDATVPDVITRTVTAAESLAGLVGAEITVDVREVPDGDRFDVDPRVRELSRRELFRSGRDSARRAAAAALSPLEHLAGAEPARGVAPLPTTWTETLRLLEAAGLEPDTRVPARLPIVEPGCILCPACTRVCPTDAFARVFDEAGGVTLRLDPQRCVGCDACAEVCPVHVIRMEDEVTWAELSRGASTVAVGGPGGPPPGGVQR